MPKAPSKAEVQVAAFLSACKRDGWTVARATDSVVTIQKDIGRDNREGFCAADSEYYGILSFAPQTQPGSIWGTDGGGVGALSAMRSGRFVMNKSGVSARFLSALTKAM